MRKSFLVMAVLALLCLGGMAQAITLSAWAATPTQQVGDKIFTYTSSNLPGTTNVAFMMFSGSAVLDLTWSYLILSNQYLNYTIAIDQAMSPNDVFDTVSMDSSRITGTTLVTKTISGPNPAVVISTSNGNPSLVKSIPGNLKSLTVGEVFTGGGYINDVANSFTEKTLPEPSSIIVLLGGLGSLLALRRRRA